MSSRERNRRIVLAVFSILTIAAFTSCTSHTSSLFAAQSGLTAGSPGKGEEGSVSSAAVASTDISATGITEKTLVESEGLAPDTAIASAPRAAISDEALSTRTITTTSDTGIGVDIEEGQALNRVIIDAPKAANLNYKVSRLSAPDRLVIDINGEMTSKSKKVAIADLEYVSSVRIGSHPGKTRIVIDMVGSGVEYKDSLKDGKIVLNLQGPMIAGAPLAQGKFPPAKGADSATGETKSAAKNRPAKPLLPADEEMIAETKTVQLGVAKNTGENSGSSELVNLKLEKTGSSDAAVVAELSQKTNFELVKTAPSEYVAYLDNTTLSATLVGTTIIAPPNGAGIRTVRPVVEGDKVLLRIFAQPGTDLDARVSGTDLLIETTDRSIDMRAQVDPKKTEEQASKPAVEPAKEKELVAPSEPKISVSKTENASVENDDLAALLDGSSQYTGKLISLDLQDTDIDNALRIIAEVSNLNIVTSEDVAGKVTLRLIDVPWDQALDVILKTNGLDKVIEGSVMRIAPVEKLRQERESLKQAQQAEEELEPLNVKYLRISYAKASEIKSLVETVLSERGTVAYDERSNQLIVKDVKKGIKNVVELVNKIDLRTPQVLLETQIVESTRSLFRDLGTRLGFTYVASPSTGNATGYNFPNSVSIGGANVANFASQPSPTDGSSVIDFLFGSADGSRSLDIALSQLEKEGRVRIVSRPAVATINNKRATIKSVEKIRILLPTGGFAIGVGQGAAPQGQGAAATETVEIGIVLNVTPQASPDYYVLLDIDAKSSTFGSRAVQNIPSEVERSATSTVLVSSGQTFALGGIYKVTDRTNVTGVPFLKDIPVLGHFFRRNVVDNADEELLFFITPRIVEGSFDDASMKAGA